MACRLSNFKVGKWETAQHRGHVVEVAPAKTACLGLEGVVFKLDGRFKGFTGSRDAAFYFINRELNGVRP